MKKVKYLHIFWHPDVKFLPKFVRTINEETEYFNPDEHLFLTPYQKVYNAIKEYGNTVLVGNETDNLITRFGKDCDWIIVHALNCGKIKLLFTPKKYAKKVIWRTWGHDLKELPQSKNPFKKFFLSIYKKLYVRKIRQFYAIGIANEVDVVAAKKLFGNDIRTLRLNYGYENGNFEKALAIKNSIKEHPSFRILVGHSGSKTDRHFEVLDALAHLKGEDITICLILSYGADAEYYNSVEAYARNIFGNKVEVVHSFMERYEYLTYLSTMDLVCFNQIHSAGLSNLHNSLFFGKRTAFNAHSPFVDTFNQLGFKYYIIDDLSHLSLDEIRLMEIDTRMVDVLGQKKNKEQTLQVLMNSFKTLDKVDINGK